MNDFSTFELIVLHFLAAVTGIFLGYVINITGFFDQDVGEFVKKIWRKRR